MVEPKYIANTIERILNTVDGDYPKRTEVIGKIAVIIASTTSCTLIHRNLVDLCSFMENQQPAASGE